jgi:Zn-dependent protease
MEDRNDWSVGVGRWFGVPVRMHAFLFLFVLVIGSLEWNLSERSPSISGTSFVYGLALLVCVLVHELSHALAAISLGGSVRSIILTPWGGFSELNVSDRFHDRMIVYWAGIFANSVLFFLGGFLVLQAGRASLGDLVNPLRPPVFESLNATSSIAQIFVWLNFQIAFVNLTPSYPFDFAQIMRTMFGAVNEGLSDLKIESTVKAIGQLSGAVLIGIGVLLRDQSGGPIEPMWAMLVGAGISVYFAARFDFRRRLRQMYDQSATWVDDKQRDDDTDLIYDTEERLEFLTDENGYSQWLIEKRQERERGRAEIDLELEREEERRADEVLIKLHDCGIESLTFDERRLLERVSARIRQRRQPGSVE